MKPETPEKVNEVAKFVAKKWQRSNSRNGDYQLFNFDDQSQNLVDASGTVKDAVYLDIDQSVVADLLADHPKQFSLAVPVNAKSSIALDLVEVTITSFDFEVELSSGNTPPSWKEAVFYRGIIRGNTNSWAAISIFDGQLTGLIADEYGNYILGAVENTAQYAFFNDDNFVEDLGFSCEFNDEVLIQSEGFRSQVSESSGRQMMENCVRIYFETDFHSYGSFNNNATAVMNFVMGSFNQLETFFQNEQISIEMSGLKIWDTQDAYGGQEGANCGPVLTNFTNAIDGNFNGDLAHLITAINPSGGWSICGLAWVGCNCTNPPSVCNAAVYCNNFASSTAVSQTLNTFNNFPTYSTTISILAHELGHNFGSPHTHACAWNGNNTAIDGCAAVEPQTTFDQSCNQGTVTCSQIGGANPGTIMSYCGNINFNLGFGPQPGALIRSNYQSANCLMACTNAVDDLGDGVCRSSMTITDADIPGATGNFRSASTIITDGVAAVENGETVNFLATTSITLTDGFTAEAGSDFNAKIEACNVPALQSNEINLNSYLAASMLDQQIDHFLKDEFTIIPNPANEQLSFHFDLSETSEVSIQIFNTRGQLVADVLSRQLLSVGYHQMTYQLQHLRAGMYYTVFNKNGAVHTQKLILAR
ncbi:MAG: zinc-dependent metalloprotease [Bacteroidota bacterium]